jgi:hypothetical protein
MDRTIFQLVVVFIVGLALGVGQYRERLNGEGLEKDRIAHSTKGPLGKSLASTRGPQHGRKL